MPPKQKDKLTAKQARFCQEYTVDYNGTQAAIRAGFSAHSAAMISYEYLRKPHIKERIAEIEATINARHELTTDRVKRQWSKTGWYDARQLFDDNGNVLLPHEIDADTAQAITGIKVKREIRNGGRDGEEPVEIVTTEYKLVDKKGVVDSVAKHLGMLTEKHEHTFMNIGSRLDDAFKKLENDKS